MELLRQAENAMQGGTVQTSHVKMNDLFSPAGFASQVLYSEDADDGTRTRNHPVINRVL